MKRRFAGVLWCAGAVALCVFPAGGQAEAPAASPVNGTATLTVTYELKGGGEDLPQSHERHVSWSVTNRYTVAATMTAQKPSGFAGMHKPDAAEQAREADRAAAANAAAASMLPMMEQVEQIMKLCGEDEACITRETMKMSQGIDPNSAQMQSAKANIAKASVMPEARYQAFMPATQSATFAVTESAREAYFDAACSLKTEERCAYDSAVSGEGDITDASGSKVFQTGASAEIDYQTGSLILTMTIPGVATVKKTVTSQHNPQVKAGTTEERRAIRYNDVAKEAIEVSCGDCRTASGSFEKEVTDELLGRPARLVVTWSFKRS